MVGVIALLVAAGLVVTRGFVWRARVEVAHASLSPEGALLLHVDTCGGDPVIDLIEETSDEVRVAVVSTRRMFRGGGDCRD
ncbi:MAG TPA: hypothetical protein VLC50_07360, partial [Actinomycetes bacterium]|nr:hypothetical protein [Actinomycetes bacterium]